MPMVIARNNNMQFPSMGDNIDLFKRLSEYINTFDKTWIKKIKPASQEQIEELRNVSQLKKYANDFPKPYLIFLETMGVDDGGLLSKYLVGKSNIQTIINIYHEYERYEPEVFETPYLAIFDEDMDRQLSIDLSKKNLDNEFAVEKDACIMFESFEKLLFQAAFLQFENFGYVIYFSASDSKMKKAMEKHQIEDIFEEAEKIGKKNALKKAWFSDTTFDIMLGKKLSFGVKKTEGGGANGLVTGEEVEIVEQVAKEVMDIIGARITYSNLP